MYVLTYQVVNSLRITLYKGHVLYTSLWSEAIVTHIRMKDMCIACTCIMYSVRYKYKDVLHIYTSLLFLQFGRRDYTILRRFKEIKKLIDSLLSSSHGGINTTPLYLCSHFAATCLYICTDMFCPKAVVQLVEYLDSVLYNWPFRNIPAQIAHVYICIMFCPA